MSGSTKTNDGVPKKYTTVGTIKTIDLSKHTFTLEPITRYRFQVKDDDENSWMIIFKKDEKSPSLLRLIKRDVKFVFDARLTGGLIVLKQNKTRITVKVGSLVISKGNDDPKDGDEAKRKIADAINASALVEIEIL